MHLSPGAEAKLGFDAVRRRLDALAVSAVGREALAALQPSADRAEVERRLARAAEMLDLLRFGDALVLAPLPDVRPQLRRAQPKGAMLEGPDLAEIGQLAGTMRRVSGYFHARGEAYPALARLANRVAPLGDLEDHVGRVVDEQGRIKETASAKLVQLTRDLGRLRGQLESALQAALRAASAEGWAAEEQPTIRSGRAVIPVRAEARRKVRGFVHDVSSTGHTVYVEPEAVLDLNNEVRELEAERRREVERILRAATAHVRSLLPELREGLDALARLDAAQAAGRLAVDLDAAVPALNDAGAVRLVGVRNAALGLHFRAQDGPRRAVVPLDLALDDARRAVVITGPNAGGKSVAMKTVGLSVLMAQCGLAVPADPGTSLPVLAKLFVDIGDEQSIQDDLSTFTSHVARLRRMLAEADDRTLVLIDEAGTGTDPAEGGALAQAALEALVARGARVVATTHHGGLKAYAHEAERVENGSMAFDPETLAPTYRFRLGVPGSSYAFEIAGRVGLDAGVLARARALTGEGKARLEDLLAEIDARAQHLQDELDRARREAREAERVRERLEAERQKLADEREATLGRALAEAEAIVKGANSRVERTIREIKEAQAETEATREAREKLERFKASVENRARKVQRTGRKAAPQPRRAEASGGGPLAVGDQVRLDGGQAVGEVLELDEKEALLALGQMKVRARLSRLEKVGGPRKQRVEVRSTGTADVLPATVATSRVDVRGCRADEALPRVEHLLDQAALAGLHRVEILHGKGTGALKAAVEAYLAGRPDVAAFDEAAWNQGGGGVTVVELA